MTTIEILLVATIFANLAIATAFLIHPTKRGKMQAKFTITFTESAAVPPIQLATTSFNGIVGTPESGSLGPSGGNGGPFVVTVDPTTPLPDGVALDSSGNVSGTPTAAGSTSVNVTVADSQG